MVGWGGFCGCAWGNLARGEAVEDCNASPHPPCFFFGGVFFFVYSFSLLFLLLLVLLLFFEISWGFSFSFPPYMCGLGLVEVAVVGLEG